MTRSNYDKFPFLAVRGCSEACVIGWDAIARRVQETVRSSTRRKTVVVVECYPGVFEEEVLRELQQRIPGAHGFWSADALYPEKSIESLVDPFVGGNDPVFGFMCNLELHDFFDSGKLLRLQQDLERISEGIVLVVGCGARLIHSGDILVYADLARWEAQNRFRRNETANLGVANSQASAAVQYRRAFFVDWRVADRFKRPLMGAWDFVLDTNTRREPKLAEGEAVREALRQAVRQPFRVVPLFDPAPWGGQWMKNQFDLDRGVVNYGWCFDCVPEENSLLLGFGEARFEIPSIDLVFAQPEALLGERVQALFGDEFPIRFDFLDTVAGGNLSFQVHPLKEYIHQHFGMSYTQDESYYLLDAGPDAAVYLGLREGVDREAMKRDLIQAQNSGTPFNAEHYACKWPARKHDHFLIPAGTVHCSGADAMVLEISATPYIFTFKMWDWGRLGLDGKPRPIHLNDGLANIVWERTEPWIRRNLVNRVEPLGAGDGWREERTGLHESEFIETRRHWFSRPVPHDTEGTVNVLNLIEGSEAIVESPDGAFDPFVVHYAETFIMPARLGRYTIRPHGLSGLQSCATLKAYVR